MLKNGQNSSHGATKVVGVQSHGDMDTVGASGSADVAVAESGGFPEDGEGGTEPNGMDGGGRGGEKKEERQEAEEWEQRGAPEGHPAEE